MTAVPLPFPPDPPTAAPTAGDQAVTRQVAADLREGDPWDVRRPAVVPPALADFVTAGVLGPTDVHVAATLARLGGDDRAEVLLAAALAVRAPRRRHVCVDLTTVRAGVVSETAEEGHDDRRDRQDDPVDRLPWPDPATWREALRTSPLVAVRDPADLAEPDDVGEDVRPLTLAGGRLYLDRYWRYERRVASALADRARRETTDVAAAAAAAVAAAFDGAAPDRQRVAAASVLTRHLTVVAGGPGTGKTTTVARMLRLLDDQARRSGRPAPHVALAAPTGKAAARLTASLRDAAAHAPGDDGALATATATTVHRLLGARGTSSRFRHDRGDPLPHDVVVIDETSMVPLALLAKLLDAIRSDARVVLLGDPHQLASVEAGSVLGDVVGDPSAPPARSAAACARLAAVAGEDHVAGTATVETAGVGDALVVLDRVHRFRAGSGLDRLADAIRRGDADAACHLLVRADDLTWVVPEDRQPTDRELGDVHDRVVTVGRRLHTAAAAGDGATALAALDDLRVLCAHRRGEPGVAGWTARIEAWLADAVGIDLHDRWYAGRPVLFTTNDRRLQLWNGDLGVVVGTGDRDGVQVAFPALDGAGTRRFAPSRLGEVDTVHAMTVHKSQGSQVRHAVVVLPDPASRICTRELLYTAVTRAQEGATVVATEDALRATIAARTQRASGLGAALGR